MNGTYFKWWGFSINEGGRIANIHISWFHLDYWLFFYIFIWEWRYYKMFKRRLI